MKLLLDTHIWLWSLLAPQASYAPGRHGPRGPKKELWLSAMSTWGLVILVERKRVALEKAVDLWIRETMAAVALREAPITLRIVLDAAGPSCARRSGRQGDRCNRPGFRSDLRDGRPTPDRRQGLCGFRQPVEGLGLRARSGRGPYARGPASTLNRPQPRSWGRI